MQGELNLAGPHGPCIMNATTIFAN